MATNGNTTVKLLGRDWPVSLPDFATREEVVVAYSESASGAKTRILRVYAAALGLSTGIGKAARASYADVKCDPYVYGGQVYAWLREKGVTPADVATAAIPLVTLFAEALFPREEEVKSQADFTGPPVGSLTE